MAIARMIVRSGLLTIDWGGSPLVMGVDAAF